MKILCVGDSLGRPRYNPSVVENTNVWPVLLESCPKIEIVYKNFIPTRQSKDLIEEFDNNFLPYEYDLVIVQVGVVELYPRSLKRVELEVIKRLPYISSLWRFIERKFRPKIVSFRNISYGRIDNYIRNMEFLKQKLNEKKVVFIPPLPHPESFEKRSPGYNSKCYELVKNPLFNSFSEFLRVGDWEKIMCEDGHHLSLFGHQILCDYVCNLITVNDNEIT